MRWRICWEGVEADGRVQTKKLSETEGLQAQPVHASDLPLRCRKSRPGSDFYRNLRHTKGKWAGKRFWLLPWQEQIIRDVFGIVDEKGNRQFRTAYVEIGKKNGKSELAAAVALYLLFADNEPSAEVYGAAADRQQASIVFDVAHQMVQMTPALLKRCKIMQPPSAS